MTSGPSSRGPGHPASIRGNAGSTPAGPPSVPRLLRWALAKRIRDAYLLGFHDGYAAAEAAEHERVELFGVELGDDYTPPEPER
jgi:hypothetical protein